MQVQLQSQRYSCKANDLTSETDAKPGVPNTRRSVVTKMLKSFPGQVVTCAKVALDTSFGSDLEYGEIWAMPKSILRPHAKYDTVFPIGPTFLSRHSSMKRSRQILPAGLTRAGDLRQHGHS